MSLIAKRLRIMGRLHLVSLLLLCGTGSGIQAQIAQPGTIVGPDGRNPAAGTSRPAHPSLEEQLRRKKSRETAPPLPTPDAPATPTDELLAPEEKARIDQIQEEMNLKEQDPRFRLSLGLAPTHAQKFAGPVDKFHFDPGIIWQTAWRLSDPNKPYTFWTGLHAASWYGTARSSTSFSRFAVLHAGPLMAFEWRGKPRQTLAFGLSGSSRQADPEFPGDRHKLATKRFGLDGSGLWFTYGLGFRQTSGWEWEVKAGAQSSASYLLTFVSCGVSLWTD
jgi:hypothetical protein